MDTDIVIETGSADGEELSYQMPCAEAMIAATLALMTGYAQCGCAGRRAAMAAKAAENLRLLSAHPLLSDGFRGVAHRLLVQWQLLAEADARREALAERARWIPGSDCVH